MRRLVVLVVVGLGTAVLAAGCNRAAVTVGPEQSGTSVTLEVGQQLKVALPSNPSTGYSWQVVSVPSCLESVGESEFESEAEEGVVGAGGTETFTFSGKESGTGSLELEYTRSWETGVEPEDAFAIDVTVSD